MNATIVIPTKFQDQLKFTWIYLKRLIQSLMNLWDCVHFRYWNPETYWCYDNKTCKSCPLNPLNSQKNAFKTCQKCLLSLILTGGRHLNTREELMRQSGNEVAGNIQKNTEPKKLKQQSRKFCALSKDDPQWVTRKYSTLCSHIYTHTNTYIHKRWF